MSTVLGTCLWCGNELEYMKPGDPPYDALTDSEHFYLPANVWRNFALTDTPVQYGMFCPYAPAHPLGQFSIHQLAPNIEQP